MLTPENIEWWQSQTPDFRKRYLTDHPKSKYAMYEKGEYDDSPKKGRKALPSAQTGKKKKKKDAFSNAAPKFEVLSPKTEQPKIPEQENSDGAAKPEVVDLITIDDPALLKEVEESIEKEATKYQIGKVFKHVAKHINSEDVEKRESAKMLATAACFLLVLAVGAVTPLPLDSVNLLAHNAADSVWQILKDEKEKEEKDDDEPLPVELRSEEKHNLEKSSYNLAQLGINPDGNFDDEEIIENITDSIINRKPSTIT